MIKQSPSKKRSTDWYCSHAFTITRGTEITAALFSIDLESFLLNVRFIDCFLRRSLSKILSTYTIRKKFSVYIVKKNKIYCLDQWAILVIFDIILIYHISFLPRG